jgi:peptidoglycan/LPS O-acetylase OafA/YrhL
LLAYVVLWCALVPGGVFVHYRRLGDYSYGLYLWQFPVQQCLVRAFPGLTPGSLMASSFPITLVLAMLSWRFIEAPALTRKPALEVRP